MNLYLYQNEQQVGPFSEHEIRDMVAAGEIADTDFAWSEGLPEWLPLNALISFAVPDAFRSHSAAPPFDPKGRIVQTNVQQGAIVGGFLCFALGISLMLWSPLFFFFYGPLFLVAFILSIVAMAQRRVFGGIALLLATLIVPIILALRVLSVGASNFARSMDHRPPNGIPAATPAETSEQPTAVPLGENAQTESLAQNGNQTERSMTTPTPMPESSGASSNPQAKPKPVEAMCATLDAKNGFRNVRLGMAFTDFAAVRLQTGRMDPDEQVYFVEGADMKIGSAKLQFIELVFSEGILKKIRLTAEGKTNSLGLKESLIAAYGNPVNTRSFGADECRWDGAKTHLVFSTSDMTGGSDAEFTNDDVNSRVEAAMKQKAKAEAAAGAQNL